MRKEPNIMEMKFTSENFDTEALKSDTSSPTGAAPAR